MDKTQDFVAMYPELFPDHFLIECGEGWSLLIEKTCKYFMSLLHPSFGHTDLKEIKFSQIKEKFGGIRLYFDAEFISDEAREKRLPEIYVFTGVMESMSYVICEDCGRIRTKDLNVSTRGGGWVRTLCDDCYKPKGE